MKARENLVGTVAWMDTSNNRPMVYAQVITDALGGVTWRSNLFPVFRRHGLLRSQCYKSKCYSKKKKGPKAGSPFVCAFLPSLIVVECFYFARLGNAVEKPKRHEQLWTTHGRSTPEGARLELVLGTWG